MSDNNKIPDSNRFLETSQLALTILSPEDITLLQGLVIEYVENGPKPAERSDLAAHVAEHFMSVFPALMKDPRAADAFGRMESRNSARSGASEPPSGPPSFDNPPPSAGFVAGGVVAAAAVIVAGAYIGLEALAAYCGDVHPAEGESANVNC